MKQYLSNFYAGKQWITMFPRSLAERFHAAPLSITESKISIGITSLDDQEKLKNLRFALDQDVDFVLMPHDEIETLIKERYDDREYINNAPPDLETQKKTDKPSSDFFDFSFISSNKKPEHNDALIIKFVDHLLDDAIRAQASDLHLEPFEKECHLRYRIDGVLYQKKSLPPVLTLPIISRIKVMAHLDIAERRLPQDGRIEYKNSAIDFRVSTLPTQFGESVVLRLLYRQRTTHSLSTLQMPQEIEEAVIETLEKPHGLFLVTGPTGSGKTTTLYACLQYLRHKKAKLITLEDPIEYEIEGVMQIAINKDIGLSFPSTLRRLLRHDPDMIMVGETRDEETAEMAIRCSLTGHLVLTSLHTNNTLGALTRLLDMGIEPLLLSTTLETIIAQRLLRKICLDCSIVDQPDPSLIATFNFSSEKKHLFYRGQGCSSCHQTGYRGRVAIFELLSINDTLRTLIDEKASYDLLKQTAEEQGMKTLRQQAVEFLMQGITSIEEVIEVLGVHE